MHGNRVTAITIRVRVIRDIRDIRVRVRVTVRVRVRIRL